MKWTKFYLPAVALLLTACSQTTGEPEIVNEEEENKPELPVLNEREDIRLTRSEEQALASQNAFAFNLFKNKHIVNNEVNDLISPISASTCLGMLANGVEGEALGELVKALLPEGGSLDDLNSLNKTLATALVTVDNSTKLSLANSIWADKNIKLNSNFTAKNADFFNATSQYTDMYSQSGADQINSWVSENTNGLIEKIFNDAPSIDLTLVNTLYFKGSWVNPFDEKDTEKKEFLNADGTRTNTDMMYRKLQGRYADQKDYMAVTLPYGNEAYSFIAVMPSENVGLDSFISGLDTKKWSEIKKSMKDDMNIKVTLPKFNVRYEWKDLKKTLKAMGVEKLFTAKDALTGICDKWLDPGQTTMTQNAVLSVDEKGAEGAAETHIKLATCDNSIPKDPVVNLNRPFIYVIEEQSTGAVLFIGKIDKL